MDRVRALLYSVAGQLLPLFVAAWTIPQLITVAGPERVGFLTIAWAVVGYFSVFDFGISRALTKRLLEAQFLTDQIAARRVISSAAALLTIACIIALSVGFAVWRLWGNTGGHSTELHNEVAAAIPLAILAVPLAILSTALQGVLEAAGKFGVIAVSRIALGTLSFAGPLLLASMGFGMAGMICALLVGRLVGFALVFAGCMNLPSFSVQINSFDLNEAKRLLSFGGWLTISNLVGPMLLYADRFVLASMIALADVMFYTVPFEMIVKLLILPAALLSVGYPAFAGANGSDLKRVYRQFLFMTAAIVGMAALLLGTSMGNILGWWLGPEFAIRSATTARILLGAVALNSIGLVAQALIQATGRPDLTAKLHIVELPLYALYLPLLVYALGLEGAALAWGIRVALSAGVLLLIANRQLEYSTVNISLHINKPA